MQNFPQNVERQNIDQTKYRKQNIERTKCRKKNIEKIDIKKLQRLGKLY